MPGIVGLITSKPRELAKKELAQMAGAIQHERFFVTGTLIEESLGLYVGWTAREDSFDAEMPLSNETGDISLVFSGEEFSGPQTAARLRQNGHALENQEANYLVHLCEEDANFPADLNGRFHGVVVNRARQTALLFNDRFGMHRLCFHQSRDTVYFAAEPKAILVVRPELRRVDPQALGEFITCSCVLENRTLFPGIQVMPPGSAWTIRDGRVEAKNLYFQPREWEDQEPLDLEDYYQELRKLFSQNLTHYFSGSARIGMSLTGGLDSRLILAWKKLEPASVPLYSFGGMFRESQDVLLSRRLAQACGQSHQVIPVDEKFLSRFPHYAERSVYLTDGTLGVNHCTDLYVNEQARAIAPVRVTGNYGSEVLRNVRAFKPTAMFPGLFCGELTPYAQASSRTYADLVKGHPLSFSVFRQAPWYQHGLLALEETQVAVRSPFLDNDLVRTVFRAPVSAQAPAATSLMTARLIADGSQALAHIRSDRGPILNGGLGGKAVRGLIELTVKAEYAYDYGMPQWLAPIDNMLSPLRLERLFLGRHKFYHFRTWYKNQLSSYVQDMLLDSRPLARPYVNRKEVEAVVTGHIGGERNSTLEIHKLLTLELIHRLFVDG